MATPFLNEKPFSPVSYTHLPGSSIMPGKVNPVIPEVMNQICYKVMGNELCVTMAGEAAQMELNLSLIHISTTIFRLIKDIDPNAFVSQSAVIGVFGEGFDRIKAVSYTHLGYDLDCTRGHYGE